MLSQNPTANHERKVALPPSTNPRVIELNGILRDLRRQRVPYPEGDPENIRLSNEIRLYIKERIQLRVLERGQFSPQPLSPPDPRSLECRRELHHLYTRLNCPGTTLSQKDRLGKEIGHLKKKREDLRAVITERYDF